MGVCRFFARGHCPYGNGCPDEHGANTTFQSAFSHLPQGIVAANPFASTGQPNATNPFGSQASSTNPLASNPFASVPNPLATTNPLGSSNPLATSNPLGGTSNPLGVTSTAPNNNLLGGGLFGSGLGGNTGGLFGNTSLTSPFGAPSANKPLFGETGASNNIFGNAAATGKGLFDAPANANPFGSAAQPATAPSGASPFGNVPNVFGSVSSGSPFSKPLQSAFQPLFPATQAAQNASASMQPVNQAPAFGTTADTLGKLGLSAAEVVVSPPLPTSESRLDNIVEWGLRELHKMETCEPETEQMQFCRTAYQMERFVAGKLPEIPCDRL